MNQTEYARHAGITQSAVSQAIKAGKIPVEADGSIDPIRADMARRSQVEQQKARAETAKAELLELKVKTARGELIELAHVVTCAEVTGRQIRQALDSLMIEADDFVQLPNAPAVRQALKKHMRAIEERIAQALEDFAAGN